MRPPSLFLLFALLATYVFVVAVAKRWDVRSIPNPISEYKRCGRDVKSSICDPDNILTTDSKNFVEGMIVEMEEKGLAELGVLVIDQMAGNFESSSFARGVHDKWEIGSKDLENGILLFLSIQDRDIFISIGSGQQGKLSDYTLDILVSNMKPYLQQERYGDAVEHCIAEIKDILSGSKSYSDHFELGFVIFKICCENIAVVITFIICTWMFVREIFDGRRVTRMRRGTVALDRLMRDVTSEMQRQSEVDDNGEEDNHSFLSTSCPICLEDFPVGSSITVDSAESTTTTSTTSTTINTDTAAAAATTTTATTTADSNSASSNVSPNSVLSSEIWDKSKDEFKSVSNGKRILVCSVTTNEGMSLTFILCKTKKGWFQGSYILEPTEISKHYDVQSKYLNDNNNTLLNGALTVSSTLPDFKKRPMALSCNHIFCYSCLSEHLASGPGKTCPICRAHPRDVDDETHDRPPNHTPDHPRPAADRPSPPNHFPASGDSSSCSSSNSSSNSSGSSSSCSSNDCSSSCGGGGAARSNSTNNAENAENAERPPPAQTATPLFGNTFGDIPMLGTYLRHRQRSEFLFRLNRMRVLHPDVVTDEVVRDASASIRTGDVRSVQRVLEARRTRVQSDITNVEARAKKTSKGSKGTFKSSFGGGRSSGGRGGKW